MKLYLFPAIAMTGIFTVLTGVIFPLTIWGASQVLFPHQANGSLVVGPHGTLIGSEIIGQKFSQPQYFHSRPSAAGGGYDGSASSGTNLGPTSSKLIVGISDDPATSEVNESFSGVRDLVAAYRLENGLAENVAVPADAATYSASGLDPEISPENAKLQVKRVANARGISTEQVSSLLSSRTAPRFLGIFGEQRVNVFQLNLALDKLAAK